MPTKICTSTVDGVCHCQSHLPSWIVCLDCAPILTASKLFAKLLLLLELYEILEPNLPSDQLINQTAKKRGSGSSFFHHVEAGIRKLVGRTTRDHPDSLTGGRSSSEVSCFEYVPKQESFVKSCNWRAGQQNTGTASSFAQFPHRQSTLSCAHWGK